MDRGRSHGPVIIGERTLKRLQYFRTPVRSEEDRRRSTAGNAWIGEDSL